MTRPRRVISGIRLAALGLGAWCVTSLTSACAANDSDARRIADVQALSRLELAGRPVVVAGCVVTWIKLPDRSRLTIQDGTRGMWVTTTDPLPKSPHVWQGDRNTLAALEVGDELEIAGILDPGGFAPKLLARDIRVVRRGTMPEPIQPDDDQFFTGAHECCRIETSGVVQAFHDQQDHWMLVLERSMTRFEARVPKAGLPDPASQLVDARVRLVGTTIAAFNGRGELLHPRVFVMQPEDVTVLSPSPCPPFESRSTPLAMIAAFTPQPSAGHRLRTEGTITYVFPGGFSLQDGQTGIRVETADAVPVAVGDRVEVAGFLDRSRHAAGLDGAVVRVVGRGRPVQPLAITPAEVARRFQHARDSGTVASPGDYDGCLVTFPAWLIDMGKVTRGGRFLLEAEGVEAEIVARMDAPTYARLATIRPGSTLQLTGLLQLETAAPKPVWSGIEIDHFTLGIRTAADVRIVSTPSWWTAGRLAAALCTVAVALGGMVAWVGLLRRQVRLQSGRIAEELKTRHDAAIEFHATLRERSRLAANLHDTILQTLAGALLQLDVCRRLLVGERLPTENTDESAGRLDPVHQLDVTKRMVRHAADDLRGSVWALRTQPFAGRSFSQSLEAIVRHFSCDGRGAVTLAATGTPFPLPKFVAGNMLLVVQEAILNARRHARATAIDVAVHYDPAAHAVTATVRDDGVGFSGNAAGPEQGHFGLQGMRERVENLGGVLTIDTAAGRGTTVSAQIFVTDLDGAVDPDDQAALGPPSPGMTITSPIFHGRGQRPWT